MVAGGVAALLTTGVMVAVNAQAATGCQVAYTVQSQWPGGFTGNVNITNLGDPINGWRLDWTFPSGQQLNQAWNATATSSGNQVTATNMSYNAGIATNATVSFGFNGSWTTTNAIPAAFALNGLTCTGAVGGSTSPSASKSASASPSASPSASRSTSPSPSRSASPSASISPQPGNAMATVAAMQPGWNVGNTLDAVGDDETVWGNPRITRELLRQVRAQGFKSIRLPVTWTNHHGSAPDYTIDAAWLNRVREVIDWALAEDLYVLVNLHHDSWQWINTYPSDRTNVMSRYTALWTQISNTFRSYPSRLVFESINEPQFANSTDDQSYTLLNELNVEFHRIVRASGGNNATRVLVLPTLFTNAEQGRLDALTTTINQLHDPNLAATVHFYGWWPFSVNIAGGTRYDADAEKDLIGTFDRIYNSFVAKGIPVIMGEWALLNYDHNRPGVIERGEFLKYLEAVGYYARIRNVTTMLWDAGQFLNRNTLQWRDQGLYEMMKASWTTRSATASSDQVYVSRSDAISAKTLTLNLNGASFQGLRQGSANLANGSDYTVSGNTLTLSAAAVTRLVGNRAYGVNATIEAHFSQGAPWSISIITSDAPTMANATGTTTSFAIPTQFRGDQLATMAAKYADGTGAGPANWTPYKEFWSNFQPDYNANTMLLKSDFFAEVNDGARVTLTFVFWSGAQVTYYVTKSGSNVTGTVS
jgi:endoglucanase